MISNFKSTAKITILTGVLLVVAVVLFIFALIEPYRQKIYLILAGIVFVAYLVILLRKMHFFSIHRENDTLIIRFYNSHPLLSNYRQIKIKLDEFDGYELKGGWFRQEIIFKIKRGKQTGKYPPVSITLLSKDEKRQLLEMLDNLKVDGQISEQNQK